MRQSFTIVTPAPDLSLLTIQQLRAAAGLDDGDTSRDAELTALGVAISTDIAAACNVATDGQRPPTLRSEAVTETFWSYDKPLEMFLSRRFVSAVTAVSEQGSALVVPDYYLNADAGLLLRGQSGLPWCWRDGVVSVSYTAGFANVPPDLAAAASDFARIRLSSNSRDPLVKSESIEVPDVRSTKVDYWVGALPGATSGPAPPEIMMRLSRFTNISIA